MEEEESSSAKRKGMATPKNRFQLITLKRKRARTSLAGGNHREITKRNFSFGGSFGSDPSPHSSDDEQYDEPIPPKTPETSDIESIPIIDDEIPHDSQTPPSQEITVETPKQLPKSKTAAKSSRAFAKTKKKQETKKEEEEQEIVKEIKRTEKKVVKSKNKEVKQHQKKVEKEVSKKDKESSESTKKVSKKMSEKPPKEVKKVSKEVPSEEASKEEETDTEEVKTTKKKTTKKVAKPKSVKRKRSKKSSDDDEDEEYSEKKPVKKLKKVTKRKSSKRGTSDAINIVHDTIEEYLTEIGEDSSVVEALREELVLYFEDLQKKHDYHKELKTKFRKLNTSKISLRKEILYEKKRISELEHDINEIQTSFSKKQEEQKALTGLSSFLNKLESISAKAKKQLKNVEPEFDENSLDALMATMQSDSNRLDYVKSVNQNLRQAIEVVQNLE